MRRRFRSSVRLGPLTRRRPRAALAFVALLLFTPPGRAHDDQPAALAPIDVPTAVLRFEIVDPDGNPIPGRLTFVPDDPAVPDAERDFDLFPHTAARPLDLAVRRNCVSSLSGSAAITVPAGSYTIWASRGLEWSTDSVALVLEPGQESRWTARLHHDVDSSGWISGDFHLHTLTYSGHGDSNLRERIITLAAEGVEFAVATDHNHHTDYGPTVDELGAGGHLAHVTGNEVSVPIGHLNAFPLEPDRPVPDPGATDPTTLFAMIRAEPNRFGVTPVIQLNHPRWEGIDFFNLNGLDPITGTSDRPSWSSDFDTIEVLNENAGWGFYEVEPGGVHTAGNTDSVLEDWFNLLNQGQRHFAVGNSDSHTVHYAFAGYPRNFVMSSTDDPAEIDHAEIVTNIRAGRMFTTIGPFVDFRVDDAPMGSELHLAAPAGDAVGSARHVTVRARIQTASWIEVDRLRVLINGDPVIVPPENTAITRHDGPGSLRELEWRVPLLRDAWIVLLVEGDTSLAPIVSGASRPILPLAITNPVWVDVDGDGEFSSTADWAAGVIDDCRQGLLQRTHPPPCDSARASHRAGLNHEVVHLITAVCALPKPEWWRPEHQTAPQLSMPSNILGWAVKLPQRRIRLAVARGVEVLGHRYGDLPRFARLATNALSAAGDVAERMAFLRALAAVDPAAGREQALQLLASEPGDAVQRHGAELLPLLPRTTPGDWMAIGYFPNPAPDALVTTRHGPDDDEGLETQHAGKGGAAVQWRPISTRADGFLDLNTLGDDGSSDHAIAYAQTWLHVEQGRRVPFLAGTDDGCRIWLDDELIYEDVSRHGASPLQHAGELALRPGWNRIRFKVENGTGGFGLYFTLLAENVRTAARPEG